MSQAPDADEKTSETVKKTEKTIPGTEERSGDDVLLDVRRVGKYTLRPLSFGKLAIIMPQIAAVGERFKSRLPSFEELSPQSITLAIMMNLDALIPIMATYVDATEEEIRNLSAQEGTELAFNMWVMNAKTFMDFFVIGSQVAPR